MIQDGNATISVSGMQRSVDFSTGVLGLRLAFRAGDHWAQLDAGGLAIGLHPASDRGPTPGTPGLARLPFTTKERGRARGSPATE